MALGDLPGGLFQSEALAVSADGSVIVGTADVASGAEAFVWDAVRGMRSVRGLLTAAGLAPGRTFVTATGVSADGRYVTGTGINRAGAPEGWLLDLAAPTPAPATVALLWTEELPQTEPLKANSVLRLGDDTGSRAPLDIATHLGSTTGGFNGVEYSGGQILVANQGFGGGGTRTHHPAYTDLLVTNVFAYDLDAPSGDLWGTNGNAGQILRRQAAGAPSVDGLHDFTYDTLQTTGAGRFTQAIQAVGATVYFSSPTTNPIGLYKMNADGTGITSVFTGSGVGAPSIYDFEVVGGLIYFCDIANSAIRRVNLDGSGVVTLVANVDFPNSIDVTDTAIYWTELMNGRIRRSDLVGGNVEELVTDLLNPRGVVAGPLALLDRTVVVSDAFAAFLEAADVPEGQRGATDDPNGDGVVNLLAYALDIDPAGANTLDYSGTLPVVASTPPVLTLTYRRVRPDVTYVVQTTDTLADANSWTTVGVTQGTPAGDGATTASVPLPTGPGVRFLRLRASR